VKPKFTNVSRLFGYYATRVIENTVSEDSGATIRDTIKAAAKYGVVDETLWPYVVQKFATNPPKNVWDNAATHKVTSYHSIADGDLESMKVLISQGYLVGFGFAVFDYFLTASMASKAVLIRPKTSEVMQGGHAVCLVGYDDNKTMPDGSVGAFLVRNSWGTNWGLNGYYWMAYNYVSDKRLCNDFWVVQSSPI
jgi:C1A family cysteine protease